MQYPGLSGASESVMAQAVDASSGLGQRFLGVEHVFLGLAVLPDLGLDDALRGQGFELDRVQELLRQQLKAVDHAGGDGATSLTPRCQTVFRIAGRIAAQRGGAAIEPTHILAAILREGRSAKCL